MALDVSSLRAPMQKLYDSGVNQGYAWRREQLLRMKSMLTRHREEFAAALHQDLGKERTEALGMELVPAISEINLMLRHLKQWMKPTNVPSPGICIPAHTYVVPCPRTGPACLIIGPSNYPLCLSLQPAAGALAAGNPVVIKPSELCPATSAAMQKYCDEYFEPDVLRVVQGSVPEITALLQEEWGLIFFTGSQTVGKIIASAAAQTLTPTVLELGGKCPCYVDGDTMPGDIRQVANRIVWAKTMNAGQTCAAVDTLLVHESVVDRLLEEMKQSLVVQYGDDPRDSELGRIVSPRHAQRLVDLMKEVEKSATSDGKSNPTGKPKLICGGSTNCVVKEGYIVPTFYLNPPADSRIMKEEVFGPILPIVTVGSRQEAIDKIKNMPGTPLCLYVFTKQNRVLEEFRRSCPAGSVMRNDSVMHLSSPYIPFGGLGSSGYGVYHGKYSFDCFSHMQAVMYRPCFPGLDFGMFRFHPFGTGLKGWLVANALPLLPDIPVLYLGRWLWMALLLVTGLWAFGLLLATETRMIGPAIQQVSLFLARNLSQAAEWLKQVGATNCKETELNST